MRAYRVDENQREIVNGLRNAGYTVQHLHKVGKGCPDILVGAKTKEGLYNILIEIKMDDGKLTPQQIIWHADWQGQIGIAKNLNEALNIVKDAIKQKTA